MIKKNPNPSEPGLPCISVGCRRSAPPGGGYCNACLFKGAFTLAFAEAARKRAAKAKRAAAEGQP
jgi:hypothetical protein